MTQRVLFLSANPADTTRAALDVEMREVQQALQRGTCRERFDLQWSPAIQVHSLQEVLDRTNPSIVHFAGHGSESREELVFADRNDRARPMDVVHVAQLLERCEGVVLSACCSAKQAEAIAARGPWAIGTTSTITTAEACTFSRTLYGKLANGCSLEAAFRGAALQLAIEGRPGSEALPQLFPGARGGEPSTAYPLTNALVHLYAAHRRTRSPIRTFHRLLMVHGLAPMYFDAAFETARTGAAGKVLAWLRYLVQKHEVERGGSASVASWEDDDQVLSVALDRARRTGAVEVDVRQYFLALLRDRSSATIDELRLQLDKATPDGFARLVEAATLHEPDAYVSRSLMSCLDLT